MNIDEENLKKLQVSRVKCNKDVLFHARYFFKALNNRKFVVNDHHKKICEALNLVYSGEIVNLMINCPPRYTKTELAVKAFISGGLALNPASKYIHLSYSDDLALDNSEAVRTIAGTPEYKALFPEVVIKKGSDSKKKWYTEAGGGVYATSTGGQVTGFGAGQVEDEEEYLSQLDGLFNYDKSKFGGALIVDDPMKPEDAESEKVRTKINNRWNSTIKNRVNSRNTPKVIMMQRVHPDDLCGYLMLQDGFTYDLEEAKANRDLWYVIALPAIIDFGKETERPLWPQKHSLEELKAMRKADSYIFDTQYQQDPQPKEGLMYSEFRVYSEVPHSMFKIRKSYTDTADKGKDYLFQVIYDETEFGIYVLDMLYTDKPMAETEPLSALLTTKHAVEISRIESNNGGENFGRSVERQCRILKNLKTKFEYLHQSANKEVRIFTNSAEVNNLIYMPRDWDKNYPAIYKHLKTYRKNGGNDNDDIEDGLTGAVEFFGKDKQSPRMAGNFSKAMRGGK